MDDLDFESVVDALSDAIVVADGGERIAYANKAVERLLGWSRAELRGAALTSIFPGLDVRNGTSRTRVRARRKADADTHVEIAVTKVLRGDRHLLCCSVRDTRTRDLEETMRARDEFLSIASHEMRTPLTPLQLHVQYMQRMLRRGRLAELTSPEVGEKLDAMVRQIARLEGLVDSLVDVARVGSRILLQPVELDLAALVHDVVARHGAQAERAGSRIEVDVDPQIVGAWDRARVEQVLASLLGNAIKFGSGEPITVRVQRDRYAVHIEVRDHGIGIALADQERIFERFERAVTAQNYGGFGLGLWIVRQIVLAMDGEVAVLSAPGEGAAFTVDLPIVAPSIPPPPIADPPHHPEPGFAPPPSG